MPRREAPILCDGITADFDPGTFGRRRGGHLATVEGALRARVMIRNWATQRGNGRAGLALDVAAAASVDQALAPGVPSPSPSLERAAWAAVHRGFNPCSLPPPVLAPMFSTVSGRNAAAAAGAIPAEVVTTGPLILPSALALWPLPGESPTADDMMPRIQQMVVADACGSPDITIEEAAVLAAAAIAPDDVTALVGEAAGPVSSPNQGPGLRHAVMIRTLLQRTTSHPGEAVAEAVNAVAQEAEAAGRIEWERGAWILGTARGATLARRMHATARGKDYMSKRALVQAVRPPYDPNGALTREGLEDPATRVCGQVGVACR
jgi:hypothetical protein